MQVYSRCGSAPNMTSLLSGVIHSGHDIVERLEMQLLRCFALVPAYILTIPLRKPCSNCNRVSTRSSEARPSLLRNDVMPSFSGCVGGH